MLSIKQDSVQDQATGLAKAISKEFEDDNGKPHLIRIDAQRQMLCASDMCKVNPKKEWDKYYRLKGTKEFLEVLSEQPQIRGSSLIISDNLGKMSERGTWVHIKIAMDLARWISPKFALFVYDIFGRFLAGDLTLAVDVAKQNNLVNNTTTSLDIATNPEDNSQIVAISTTHAYKPGEYPQTTDEVMHKVKYDLLKDKFDKMTEEKNKLKNSNSIYVNTLKEVQSQFLDDKDKSTNDHNKEKSSLEKKIDTLLEKLEDAKEERQDIQEKLEDAKKDRKVIQEKLEDAEEERQDIQEKLEDTTEKLDDVQEKLDIVLPDRVLVKKLKQGRQEYITLIEDTEPGEDGIDMYVMKRKNESIDTAFKILKKKYGDGLIVVKKIQQPNSRALWDLVEEKHKYHIIKSGGNWFRLISITKENFYSSIDALDYERKLIS